MIQIDTATFSLNDRLRKTGLTASTMAKLLLSWHTSAFTQIRKLNLAGTIRKVPRLIRQDRNLMSRSKLLYNHRHLKKLNSRLFLRKSKATKTTKVSEIIELFVKCLSVSPVLTGATWWTINFFFAQRIQEKYLNYFNIHPGPSELAYNKFALPLRSWLIVIIVLQVFLFGYCLTLKKISAIDRMVSGGILSPKVINLSIAAHAAGLLVLVISFALYPSYFLPHPRVFVFLLSLPTGVVAYYTYQKISKNPGFKKKINRAPYPTNSFRRRLAPIADGLRPYAIFFALWFYFFFPNASNNLDTFQVYTLIISTWTTFDPHLTLRNLKLIFWVFISTAIMPWPIIQLIGSLEKSDGSASLKNFLLLLACLLIPFFVILDTAILETPTEFFIPPSFEYIAFSYPYPRALGKQDSNSAENDQYNLRLDFKTPNPSYDNLVGQKPVIIPFYDDQAYYVFPCEYKGDVMKCFPEGKARIPIIIQKSDVLRIRPYWEATSVDRPPHSINHK